jgi:hypothetical protein
MWMFVMIEDEGRLIYVPTGAQLEPFIVLLDNKVSVVTVMT